MDQIKNKSTQERYKRKKRDKPKPPKKITERYLLNSGTYYLQRFTSSSAHFKSVMMRKVKRSCAHHTDQDINACETMVDDLVTKLTEYGHLDDQSYCKGMVTSLRRSGKSKRVIQMKLRTKGVCADLINATLGQYDEENTPEECSADQHAALKLAKKRKIGPFRKIKENMPENTEKKELGILARAGFSYDVCRYILDLNTSEDHVYSDI